MRSTEGAPDMCRVKRSPFSFAAFNEAQRTVI